MEPGALQRLSDRAALIAGHSGDENRSIACHAYLTVHLSGHKSTMVFESPVEFVLAGQTMV
jgi:hypothetical protein